MENFHHHHSWPMGILLNKGQKHGRMLHPCLVRVTKDGHHPKLLLAYSTCEDDSQWHDLITPHFLAGASDEIDSGLAPHFRGDQLGKESLRHHPEVDSMQTREFLNRCPLVHREWLDQTRVHKKLFVALCNLQPGWLGGALWLRQLGWWPWHPVRRAKSVRFAFDWIDSMEIPGECSSGLVIAF